MQAPGPGRHQIFELLTCVGYLPSVAGDSGPAAGCPAQIKLMSTPNRAAKLHMAAVHASSFVKMLLAEIAENMVLHSCIIC